MRSVALQALTRGFWADRIAGSYYASTSRSFAAAADADDGKASSQAIETVEGLSAHAYGHESTPSLLLTGMHAPGLPKEVANESNLINKGAKTILFDILKAAEGSLTTAQIWEQAEVRPWPYSKDAMRCLCQC